MRLVRARSAPERRQGFTLVELLVVIAIIVVLVALVGAGIFAWIATQQRNNTAGTIVTVDTLFKKHWAHVVDEAKKETPPDWVKAWAAMDASGSPTLDPTGARARVLWVKLRLMEAFPVAYAEVNGNNNPANPDPVNTLLTNYIPPRPRKALDVYQRTLGTTRYQDATANHATESAACLLMALSVNRGGASITPEQLGPAIADSDNDGVNEITDSWRFPLAFYRFGWSAHNAAAPAPNIYALNPGAAGSRTEKFADPLDPDGVLLIWPAVKPPVGALPKPWNSVTNPNAFASTRDMFDKLFHPIASTRGAGYANYVTFVFVGCGPDSKLGLTLPSPATLPAASGLAVTAASDVGDNTYSFKLK